jgi:hypothetical protein
MRSSELFVLRVLWLACTAPDCSTEIETVGKPREIKTRHFSLSKGNVTGNQVAQAGRITGITGEPIPRKNKYRLFPGAWSTGNLENVIQTINIQKKEEE